MIYYSGIGCKKNELHTEQEFLNIMKTHFMWKNWNKEISWPAQLQFKDWVLPDDFIFFTLEDWIEYAGANRLSKAELKAELKAEDEKRKKM